MTPPNICITKTLRIRPPQPTEKAVALSLLDCTTADFAPACAIWLYKCPQLQPKTGWNLVSHFAQTLTTTLEAYPQWCGQVKFVDSTDGSVVDEAAEALAPHARRFGRIYAYYGTLQDPGVEFIHATSSASLETLYPSSRLTKQPLWNRHNTPLDDFVPKTAIANVLQSQEGGNNGHLKPLMAVQVTELACGSFVLSLKSTHPMADVTTLLWMLKEWASVSRAVLANEAVPALKPLFAPWQLDALAAGDINATDPDPRTIQKAKTLPLHRYDWWISARSCPWPVFVPETFDPEEEDEPAGKAIPWAELDFASPVSNYVLHLTREQVKHLWCEANHNHGNKNEQLSQHDAILAHVWSCIVRARNLSTDLEPVHCDLVYGVRPGFKLPESFLGSPTIMLNVEMPGKAIAAPTALRPAALRIRETLRHVAQPDNLSAHLHSLAYEKSLQRIWQAFMGRRHILVTTWARAGIYNVDFGLHSTCVYAEGVIPDIDGNILIKEAPPLEGTERNSSSAPYWTDNGVDVSIHIRTEDMERLAKDPMLFPSSTSTELDL